MLEIVRTLNRIGCEAEIVATNDNGPGLLDVPLGVRSEFQGTPVWFFPRFSPKFGPLREFAYSRELTRWLDQNMERYDLVHVHAFFSYACTAAMAMARRKKIPYLVRPLGLLCTWSLQQSALRKKIYLAVVERRNLNGSAGLEYTAEQEMSEAAPLRLTAPGFVLPFGLELPLPIPDARAQLRKLIYVSADEPVFLFLSRLHPKKGLHLLLAALEKLAQRRFSVVVAGSGPAEYEAQVKAQAMAGSLRGRVHFVGFAQGALKQMLLEGADVFALTSHSESFAIAAMEALAAGTPVLISPGVPLAEIVRKFDTGWVADLDFDAIASAAARALDAMGNAAKVEARAGRCRALAANFDWPCIAARMISVYQSILERRHLPSFELSQINLVAERRT